METRLAWILAAVVALAALIVPAVVRAGHGEATTLVGVVNLNTATADELQRLPGVGPAKAQRIVEARAARPFRTVWDVTRVRGIGPGFVKRHRDRLAVTGETTLRRIDARAAAAPGTLPPAAGPAEGPPSAPRGR